MIAIARPYSIEKANKDNIKEEDLYFAISLGIFVTPTKVKKVDSTGFDYNDGRGVEGHTFFNTMDGMVAHKDDKGLVVFIRDSDDIEENHEAIEDLLQEYKLI